MSELEKLFNSYPELEEFGVITWLSTDEKEASAQMKKFQKLKVFDIPQQMTRKVDEKFISEIIENNPNLEEISLRTFNDSLYKLKKLKKIKIYCEEKKKQFLTKISFG